MKLQDNSSSFVSCLFHMNMNKQISVKYKGSLVDRQKEKGTSEKEDFVI